MICRFSRPVSAALLAATVLVAPRLQPVAASPQAGQVGLSAPPAVAITSPRAELGFDIGDDYQLANYTRLSHYWQTLDRESDRISVVEYGRTSEGRPMLMAVVTSPANHQRLDRYRWIARRLALAEGLTDEEARALAAEGRAVVWIDAGLHATEVANAQALTEMLYQMASRTDGETLRFLDDTILLAAFSNPDGLELVANWYMREPEPTKRSTANLPVLYQKYIGHDNNRESLLCNMPESTAIARVLYREWFPQIVYNQHQSGPSGAVLYIGAMRDPSNPNLHPLMAPSMELVSAHVHSRYVAEGKPGAVCRSLASYQNWYNGGVRNTACFHNQIAILSEITGNPTPTEIAFVPRNQVGTNDNPFPITPQVWHFRQAIEYLLTADRGFLDVASRHRENFLYNIYRMGRDAIDEGNRDSWTITARKAAAVEATVAAESSGGRTGRTVPARYFDLLRAPEDRDARGYILPADQPDFPTATKFVNALIKNGVAVHRATRGFAVGGRTYPAGSYVVRSAQAFRPHILDCFEPQDYPDDFEYPGGPPVRPYDMTGYTLAFEMGIRFDRVLDAFDGPFEPIEGFAVAPPGTVAGSGRGGYLLSHAVNDAFVAINQLVASGEHVAWLESPVTTASGTWPAGTIYIAPGPGTAARLLKLTENPGLTFEGLDVRPSGSALRLRPVRIGVVDQYGGSMPSGWIQWIFEQYGFPYQVVYPPALDAGGLASRFDVLVVENGLAPAPGGRGGGPRESRLDPLAIPEEYRARLGAITAERTLPQLRQFLADGGTIVAIGRSAAIGPALGVPVTNALTDGSGQPLPPEKFFAQSAVLAARVDPSHPLAYGLPERVDVVYDNGPVFRLTGAPGVQRVAWFDSDRPLRSGWAWGQEHLKDGAAVVAAEVGKGRLLLFGPLIAFRAHPHGTFKFLFNAVYWGRTVRVSL